MLYTVDLVIFAGFNFLRGGQIREFKNIAKIIIIMALLKEIENSRKLPDLQDIGLIL